MQRQRCGRSIHPPVRPAGILHHTQIISPSQTQDAANVHSTSSSSLAAARDWINSVYLQFTRRRFDQLCGTNGNKSADGTIENVTRMLLVNASILNLNFSIRSLIETENWTRKPSYRWQTRPTRKPAKICSNSTCLQRRRWQYWPIFIPISVVASQICETPRNSPKIWTYTVQSHPRSSILMSIESTWLHISH